MKKQSPCRRTLVCSLRLFVLAFLLFSVKGLSSSSEAQQFEFDSLRLDSLWGGVLGCAEQHGSFAVRNRFDDSGGLEDISSGGVSAEASRNYSECGRLALRNASSRILVDSIEDALQQGGLAFDENFRLDSSIGYVWGENITGEVDAVIPLDLGALLGPYGGGDEHALFFQPGLIFWPGLEDDERADGNIGLVYRHRVFPGVVVGGSLFYDYDFERQHERFGLGVDLQSGTLQAGLNYYHPISDWTEGRTDYEEQALRGLDLRIGLAADRVRFDTSLGLWRFEGEDEVRTKWRPSFDIKAGYRIYPGVFLQGGYEKHDSGDSLGSRWNAGLAFRFSLPELDGAVALSNPSTTPNLYEPVKREKRILYEERLGIPRVNLRALDADGNPVSGALAVEEGESESVVAVVMAELGKPLDEDVMLNVVIAGSSTADFGTGEDFTYGYKVYELDADTGEQSAPAGEAVDCDTEMCQVMVPMGVTRFDIEASILPDTDDKELAEFIDFEIEVPDDYAQLIRAGGGARVTIGAHGNTVVVASTSAVELQENTAGPTSSGASPVPGMAEVTIAVDLPSPTPITLNIATAGEAAVGTDYRISTTSLTIPARAESASFMLTGIDNGRGEGSKRIDLTISGSLPDGWNFNGDPAAENVTHSLDILDDDLAVGFARGGEHPTVPGAFLNPSRVFENISGGVYVSIESTQAAPTGGFSLQWEATQGADQVQSIFRGPVDANFLANQSSAIFNILLEDDATAEDATPVTLRLSSPNGLPTGWSLGRQEYTFTIEPSDGAGQFASADAVAKSENDDDLSVDIGLTFDVDTPSGGLPLAIAFSGGNDSADDDIRFTTPFTVPGGVKSYNVPLEIIDDDDGEYAETYTFDINQGTDFPDGWGTFSATGKVINLGDSDIVVSFARAEAIAREETQSITDNNVVLSITPPPPTNSTVPITFGGDAMLTTDYNLVLTNVSGMGAVGFGSGMIDYRANETGVRIGVSAEEDDDAISETLIMTIDESNLPAGWEIGRHGVLTVNIQDNQVPVDRTVSFSKSRSDLAESDSGDTVDIQIAPDLTANVSIPVTVAGDTDAATLSVQSPMGATFAGGMVSFDQSESANSVTLMATPVCDADGSDATITVTIDSANLPGLYSVDPQGEGVWTISITDEFTSCVNTIGFFDSRLELVEGQMNVEVFIVLRDFAGNPITGPSPVEVPYHTTATGFRDSAITRSNGCTSPTAVIHLLICSAVVGANVINAIDPANVESGERAGARLVGGFNVADSSSPSPRRMFTVTINEGAYLTPQRMNPPDFPEGWAIDPMANTLELIIAADN